MSQEEHAAFMALSEGDSGAGSPVNDIYQVVAVLNGKGGVLDADITDPSIPRMFGLHQPPAMSPMVSCLWRQKQASK